GVRRRLTARFGAEVGAWFDELPDVLSALAERWEVEFGSLIPRGSMSVVIRCQTTDGRPAVLKISPDRKRLATEAAALDSGTTSRDATCRARLAGVCAARRPEPPAPSSPAATGADSSRSTRLRVSATSWHWRRSTCCSGKQTTSRQSLRAPKSWLRLSTWAPA